MLLVKKAIKLFKTIKILQILKTFLIYKKKVKNLIIELVMKLLI